MIKGFNLSGRVAALLAGAAVIVVLLVGWFLLVSPQRSKAADLGVKINDTQAQVVATQAYVDSPSTKRAVHDLKRLKQVLPDDSQMSQVLRQLSAAAGTAGVSLDTITPASAIPSNGGEAVPIALSVTGHYFNIVHFLNLLRAEVRVKSSAIHGSGRLYSVDSIQFAGGASAPGAEPTTTTTTSSQGSSLISAKLALNTYVFSTLPATPTTTTGTTSSDTTSSDTTSTTSP
jgi:hypothetical protein